MLTISKKLLFSFSLYVFFSVPIFSMISHINIALLPQIAHLNYNEFTSQKHKAKEGSNYILDSETGVLFGITGLGELTIRSFDISIDVSYLYTKGMQYDGSESNDFKPIRFDHQSWIVNSQLHLGYRIEKEQFLIKPRLWFKHHFWSRGVMSENYSNLILGLGLSSDLKITKHVVFFKDVHIGRTLNSSLNGITNQQKIKFNITLDNSWYSSVKLGLKYLLPKITLMTSLEYERFMYGQGETGQFVEPTSDTNMFTLQCGILYSWM